MRSGPQRRPAFKVTHGLHRLSLLLGNLGSELLGQVIEAPGLDRIGLRLLPGRVDTCPKARSRNVQAKAEYKGRLDDLQTNLEEGSASTTPAAPSEPRDEIDALAGQFASAVGLGGAESTERFGSRTCALRRDQANQELNQENR
jgi:hypothetical protein